MKQMKIQFPVSNNSFPPGLYKFIQVLKSGKWTSTYRSQFEQDWDIELIFDSVINYSGERYSDSSYKQALKDLESDEHTVDSLRGMAFHILMNGIRWAEFQENTGINAANFVDWFYPGFKEI